MLFCPEKNSGIDSKLFLIMKESLNNRKIKDKSILPVIKEIQIEPQDRGKFMGVGGSTIKNIERLTGYNFIDKIISF